MNWEITFEESPWGSVLDTLRPGSSLSATRLLALLEGEGEETMEEAFRDLEDRRITLTVADLPRDYGSGQLEKRLRLEEKLVKTGRVLENLEETDPLRLYLEELAGTPAAGDPQLLAEQAIDGDERAPERLANLCMPLVLEAAYEMTGRGLLLLDLIQEASLGLWEGILNYPGGEFDGHIRWWIRQYAARAVTVQARQRGVGQKMRAGTEKLRRADKELLTRLGRNPTVEELAVELGVTPEEAEAYRDTLQAAAALAKAKAPRQEEPQEEAQAVEDTAYFQSRQRILDLLSTLTEREAKLLTLRFGLEGGQPLTAQQAGERLGLTADEAVSLEAEALSKLRKQ